MPFGGVLWMWFKAAPTATCIPPCHRVFRGDQK